ncbi:MAG: N-acetylmuramoyl-L-alanine amidase, partial [Elusimicrobia bacterium]|nr:N-acetylmuramoyl-L-alanine amidase [Elusimicrobiota bacterium]
TAPNGRWERVSVSASERVVFDVQETVEPLGFVVRFYDAHQRFDRMHFDPGDGIVKNVTWDQDSSDVVTMRVETNLAWGWGYAPGYDDNGSFYLDIHRPPDLMRSRNVLEGRHIVLDPGHGPLPSAIGPLGTTERDTNYAIALALEKQLERQGATVTLTRHGVDGPALGDRPWIAYQAGGELYLSIHNNALPPEADPGSTPRGFMHFYYQPQSRPLAEAVEEEYRKRQPELADEGLRWGDLAVCRPPFMPAMLSESAYMILPEQEERLREPSYQEHLAGTLLDGIRDYLERYREVQKHSSVERAASQTR